MADVVGKLKEEKITLFNYLIAIEKQIYLTRRSPIFFSPSARVFS